ncbi:hypothetical protein AKL21_05365 [Enterococcus canintestini]|uniref:Uncharacterized protein n=1 Tax=Enterococcus canintestini TaxID=317010 RepID=A0A267HV92_9ENTE|nr:hypothetical protein AKL21_05365 [Enterococcus canintestini]
MDKIPTFSLALITLVTVITSYSIAWYFRDDYDPKKMLLWYLVYVAPLSILGFLFRLNVILVVGIYFFGGVILVFRDSNYFNR